ncbi:MAG: pectinesterase [Deltaproteobacteria bacterium]|nr:pectinesterase [Deltaproteobacteria bacterium]
MTSRRVVSFLLTAGLCASLLGCSSDDPAEEPTGPDLDPGWNKLEAGGGAICSRGDAYSFYVHPGTVNKVVIEFEGGGACWSESTCAEGSDSFDDIVESDTLTGTLEGIADHDNPDNPFKDWWHVFVAYCTGDLHMGNRTTTHGSATIEHRGSVNAGVALDWAYTNVPAPERVVVLGCSAGGYGAIGWAPYIIQHYDGVPVVQAADCAAGIATTAFMPVADYAWDLSLIKPSFIPALADENFTTLTVTQVYEEQYAFFSDQQFSQYNTNHDETQMSFYEDMGGDPQDWSQLMNDGVSGIVAASSNFASYVAADHVHCIITKPEFYTAETGGVAVRDWFNDLANGTAVDDVHCDPDCGAPAAD